MSQTKMQTIQCPKCNAQLPGWAQHCQFCQTPIGNNVQRPAGVQLKGGFDNRLSWQEIAYIVVSIIMIILGGYDFLQGVIWVSPQSGGAFIGIMGAIQAGLGIGLLLQQTWAQFLMKWYCVLRFIFGLGTLLMGLMFLGAKSNLAHTIGGIVLLVSIFELLVTGFMLYLISFVGDVDF